MPYRCYGCVFMSVRQVLIWKSFWSLFDFELTVPVWGLGTSQGVVFHVIVCLVYIFRQCYTVCWSLFDLSLSKSDKRSEESLYLKTKFQHGIQRTWVCDMWVCACMCRSMCEWLRVLPALFLKQHHFFLDKSLTAIVSPTATLLRPPLQRSVSTLYST